MAQDSDKKRFFDSFEWMIPLVLFGVAFLIRRIGLNYGFPLTVHADEPVIIDQVVRMTSTGSLDTVNYIRPDQFLYFSNYVILNLISYAKYGQNLAYGITQDRFFFYSIGRHWVALLGALVIPVSWQIGKKFKKMDFSLAAALVFCFFPLFTKHSRFIAPDMPITLFTLLVLYFSMQYFYTGKKLHLVIAIFFAAINTIEKYPGILSLGIVFIAVGFLIIKNRKTDVRYMLKVVISILVMYLFFMLITGPNLFIHSESVTAALQSESRSSHLGADGLSWFGNMVYYVKLFLANTNFVYWGFLLIGLFGLLRLRDEASILFFYGAGYWVAISKLGLHWERWSLPMMITPLLLVAAGMTYFLQRPGINKWIKTALVGLIVAGIGLQSVDALSESIIMSYRDTRVTALELCNSAGIRPENSVFEGYTPFMPGSPWVLQSTPAEEIEQAEYIILSSGMYRRFYAEPEKYPQEIALYEKIKNERTLLYQVSPSPTPTSYLTKLGMINYYIYQRVSARPLNQELLTGPTIQIYR